MARPRTIRFNKRGDLRGMHKNSGGARNTGKKKCPLCGKFFSTEEINDHIKVHTTEDHLNNLHPVPSQIEEQFNRAQYQVHALRNVLSNMINILQDLVALERY